jgi:cell division protein FtsA
MATKPIFAAGVDAGSRKTRLAICVLEKSKLRFLGAGCADSAGWEKGRIADQNAVADSILAALRDAEAAAQVSIGSAAVGIGGPAVRGHNGHGALELGYVREIEQRDVNRVIDRAARVQLPPDWTLLHLCPQDFVVDGHPGHRDPRKMMASQLEANVHMVLASVQQHNALIGAVNQAHLLVEETVFEPLAACYGSVLPEERRAGVALADIGAHSTDLVVYYGDSLYLAATLPVCGDHFTRDLAQPLRLSFDEAELVKLEFGGASEKASRDNTWVELPAPEDRERRATTGKFINQVLEARAEELFTLIASELARVGMRHALLGGLFLTGAASRLPELCDVAERVLQCETRYGLARGIVDWPPEMTDMEWSVAAGLAMYSARLKARTRQQRQKSGWLARILE